MEWLRGIGPVLQELVPVLVTVAVVSGVLAITRLLARSRERRQGVPSIGWQIVLLVLTAIGIAAVVVALPVSDALRGRLLGLLGIALTGVIAFSSTTFVSNAMAGLMLRAVGNFRPGDWVRVGDQFGRVTERGLFHTEIQTEDRDLATLPNLFLVTQPVKVVRDSGTVVTSELSLGYDLDHVEIEALLVRAAGEAGLEDAFVRIRSLNDFSVTYAVSGFLAEVKNLLSVHSRLNASVLDTLHGAGVEIVSPTFMNQRREAPGTQAIPAVRARPRPPAESAPEALIFDKAERRASLEALRSDRAKLEEQISTLEASDAEDREARLAHLRRRVEAIARDIEQRETAEKDEGGP